MGGIGDGECCRMERYKFAFYSIFKEPRLYRYAVNGDWDLIPQRALTHPKEAQFVHAFGSQDTPLHTILKSAAVDMDCKSQQTLDRVKLNAVAALLSAHRQAVSTKNGFGQTPLHFACMDLSNCGEEVTSMLVDARHNAACVQDLEGRSPLHYLVARNDCIPIGILAKVISACPDALHMMDAVRETPLDIVIQRVEEIEDGSNILKFIQDSNMQYLTELSALQHKKQLQNIDRVTTV